MRRSGAKVNVVRRAVTAPLPRVPDAALREKTRAAFFDDLVVVGRKLSELRGR